MQTFDIDFRQWLSLLVTGSTAGAAWHWMAVQPTNPISRAFFTQFWELNFLLHGDRVQYLLPDSCQPSHVTTSIPYSLALRIVWICSEQNEREEKFEDLRQMLISRNYNRNIVNAAIIKAKGVPREVALQEVVKKPNERVFTFLICIMFIFIFHWLLIFARRWTYHCLKNILQ